MEKQKSCCMAFLYLEKAYDRLQRDPNSTWGNEEGGYREGLHQGTAESGPLPGEARLCSEPPGLMPSQDLYADDVVLVASR